MGNIIQTEKLSKRFGKLCAVDKLTFAVPEGSIYAFLGPNGAGKTTTIKLLMNIIRPTQGNSIVLGIESKKLNGAAWRQIGYVSENQKMPEWMTIGQFLAYVRPMYPAWDNGFCQKLLRQFDLPLNRNIWDLSRGMKIKAALLSSLSYRPRLLVLDEPFSGLDPLARDEVVTGILELAESENWTIFISSHDINEVERLSDWVGIIDKGTLRLSEMIETLQNRFRKVTVTTAVPLDALPILPEQWLLPEHNGRIAGFIDSRYEQNVSEAAVRNLFSGCTEIGAVRMTLREIFVALAKTFKLSDKLGGIA